MSSQELSEWIAFYQLEPWGADVEDWRAALVAATVANTARDPKRQRKPFQPSDFMPRREASLPKQQTADEQMEVLLAWQAAFEAKFSEQGGG